MKHVNFRNILQVALFKCELSGQISDGKWENSKPYDHHYFLRNLEVEIDSNNVGKNFISKNYNFASKDLLECVGNRMLRTINLAGNGYSTDIISRFHSVSAEDLKDYNTDYWKKYKEELIKIFGSVENFKLMSEDKYDMQYLKEELKEMTNIFKMVR